MNEGIAGAETEDTVTTVPPQRTPSVLSQNLAILLPRLGTDKEVAQKLGVDTSTVWRWRDGQTLPRESVFVKLCQLAQLDPGTLRYSPIT